MTIERSVIDAELVGEVTYADARRSVDLAKEHGEKLFEQLAWQVENEAWTVLGYADWNAMREAEYADLGAVIPRADRPEMVARLRRAGLTQQETADTLGVSRRTVQNEDEESSKRNFALSDDDATVTNTRGQQRPASYKRAEDEPERTEPTKRERRRRPLPEVAQEHARRMAAAVESLEHAYQDERFSANIESLTIRTRGHIRNTMEACQRMLARLEDEGNGA